MTDPKMPAEFRAAVEAGGNGEKGTVTIRWADHPGVEDRLKALDHLDAALALVPLDDERALDHIHKATEEVRRSLGSTLFHAARAASDGRPDPNRQDTDFSADASGRSGAGA